MKLWLHFLKFNTTEMKNHVIVATMLITMLNISSFIELNAKYNKPPFSNFIDINSFETLENEPENQAVAPDVSGKKIKMTSLAYGGTGVLFTTINNQPGVMTGGRGSATFNNRYTFGGGGWGMIKGVEINSNKKDTLDFFNFGYGGIEFGYVYYEGQKLRFGSNLLVACGAGFQETYPKSRAEVKMFPVFEPSLYSQIPLGKLLRADVGVSYRFVTGSKFTFINNRQLSGISIYIAFLAGTCNCN